MRRLLFHHKVALWAFAIGVMAVALWNAAAVPARRIEADWRKSVLVMAYWRGLERIFPDEPTRANSPLDHNSFSYRDYTVESWYNPNTQKLSAVIKKRGRLTRRLLNQTETSNGQFQASFRSLLGKSSQQLETVYYTGGAHCCEVYRIYDLYPRFRPVFDSELYQVGDEMYDEHKLADLNHDGVLEIIDRADTFAYFDSCFACSSFPVTIFQYNRAQGVYLPANRLFQHIALRGLSEAKKHVELYSRNLNSRQFDIRISS